MVTRRRLKPQVPDRLARRKGLVYLAWKPDLLGKIVEPLNGRVKVMWLNGNIDVVPKEWVLPVGDS